MPSDVGLGPAHRDDLGLARDHPGDVRDGDPVRGELPAGEAVAYTLAQVVGGILCVLLAHAMFELPLFQMSVKARTGAAQGLAEFTAAFGLVLTILLTLRTRREAVAMSVGLYIVAAYWFTASTSFANPAVTIARAFSDTFAGIRMTDVAPFIIAQLVGALFAMVGASWLFRPALQTQTKPMPAE